MNTELARHNMIEQQIRPWDVLDPRVLDLLRQLPREEFVPDALRHLAFVDMNLPLGHGEVMMSPKMEARLLQALELTPKARVLEVGTGSGYFTALLARLAGQVYSVDIEPAFAQQARARLASHGITNVEVECGDAARGWDAHGPYDAIVLTGSVPVLPEGHRRALAIGARLCAVVGTAPVMEAVIVQRTGPDGWRTTSLFETELPPLRNAEAPARFVF